MTPHFNHPQGLTRSLGEEFTLCDNGSMVFHWADFNETCDQIKEKIESNYELKEEFDLKEKNLNRLNLIPVWIKTPSKVYQTTMFALYERHILNRTSAMAGLDFFGPLDISLISGTGPFKSMAVSEFFNRELYQDFILVNLIKGLLPKRDFRIRLKAKVLMEYGEQFEKAGLVHLEQLTTRGILLGIDTDFYQKDVSRSNQVRILLDTRTLAEATRKDLPELKAHLSQHVFNLMYSSRKEDALEMNLKNIQASSSFEFLKEHKKYLFVPYSGLTAHDGEGVERIMKFVNHSKELIREYYAGLTPGHKSA